MKDASAISIAQAFTDEFICIYGSPKALLTDQGAHFLNNLMRIIAKKFKIKHYKTTAYRPQSNGSVERSHHVIWKYLKQFTNKNDWDSYLKLAAFSYNTSIHESTRYTPYELVFRKIARAPSSDSDINDLNNESYSTYLINLFNKIKDVQMYARENLINSKHRSKYYYDKKTKMNRININDMVYLLKEPRKNKLSDQYTGPYRVIDILDNNNVRLELSKNKYKTVHLDKIKLCKKAISLIKYHPP
jgi:hypothetical protein